MTISTNKSLSETFVLVFYAISEILGAVVDGDNLMSTLEINQDRCFVLWSPLRRILTHTDKYFEKV